jgi:hypothetical protein
MDNQNIYNELINMPLEDYQRYYETIADILPHHIKEMNMYYCKITDYKSIGNDLVIGLDNSEGVTIINKVIFRNYELIKQECSLMNARWLDNWVFILEDGYLFGSLFEDADGIEKIDFYVKATDVEFV